MSMLAERKRKTKWVVNPTKKPLWTTDPNGIKFGKGLMEKMGWSTGKGLGANEQGIQEPLKVSYKNDTKGMGFKGNDDDWIEHQDEFNCFLNQLRNCDESYVVRISDAEKNEVKSLEEKSKWSKARVHYQKFTRGKDLSKYSEHDLACILGTNKTKNEKSKVEEVIQPEPNINNNNMETHFGVTTINSGSMQDYFKKKWIFHKNSKGDEGDETVQNENSYFSTHEDDSCEVKDEKKSKKKKLKLTSEECDEAVIAPHEEKLNKKKKKKKKREREVDSEEETENKRKKNDFDLINDFSEDVMVDLINNKERELNGNNDDCESEKFKAKEKSVFESIDKDEEKVLKDQKKKKKKKDKEKVKNEDRNCIENGVRSEEKHEDFEVEPISKKKKKSKKEKHLESSEDSKVSSDISGLINQSNTEIIEPCLVIKKKKKKKDKKEKSVEKKVEDCCSDVNSETEVSSELGAKQKKKKDKKEKIEFAGNTIPNLEKENKNAVSIEVSSEVESVRKKKKKKKDKEDINEAESPTEVEENRKKSKKKNKKESEEVENLKNSEININNCSEEEKKSKKRETLSENEPVKKKMKKSKTDRSSEAEDIEVTSNNNETTCGLEISEEITTKVRSGKKKKDKKEKIEFFDNDGDTIAGDKKKKNKQKDKMKETSIDYKETQDSEFCLRENNSENEEKNTEEEKKNILDNSCEDQQRQDKDRKKSDIVNNKKLDFSTSKSYNNGYNKSITNLPLTSFDFGNCYNSKFFNSGVLHQQNVNILNAFNFLYSYYYFNNVLNAKNWNADNENAIQSHKIEFLEAKKPDKFYPGQDRREKILRLIHLSDFSEFKGSNLEKLPGYGFLKEKIFNKPA